MSLDNIVHSIRYRIWLPIMPLVIRVQFNVTGETSRDLSAAGWTRSMVRQAMGRNTLSVSGAACFTHIHCATYKLVLRG